MKKIQKNTHLGLTKSTRAGRPAKLDIGIRHISREKIHKLSPLHLTIKVRENKADIKSKRILKALHHAIKRGRLKRLKIIHYTLEYNHIHLLVEVADNIALKKGMQALGISLAKAINKIKCLKGSVYKHRYHFRRINSKRDLKNVSQYIFRNGLKHKRAFSIIDPYNSLVAEKRIPADINKIIKESAFLSKLRRELKEVLDEGRAYFMTSAYLWRK